MKKKNSYQHKYFTPLAFLTTSLLLSSCGGGGGSSDNAGGNPVTAVLTVTPNASTLYADTGESTTTTFTVNYRNSDQNLSISTAAAETSYKVNITGVSTPFSIIQNDCTSLKLNQSCAFEVKYTPTETQSGLSISTPTVQVSTKSQKSSILGAEKTFVLSGDKVKFGLNASQSPSFVKLFSNTKATYPVVFKNDTSQAMSKLSFSALSATTGITLKTADSCAANSTCDAAILTFTPSLLKPVTSSLSTIGTQTEISFDVMGHTLQYSLGFLIFASYGANYPVDPIYDLGMDNPTPSGSIIYRIEQFSPSTLAFLTERGFFMTLNKGASWDTLPQYHLPVTAYASYNDNIFIGTEKGIVTGTYDTITGLMNNQKTYSSTDHPKIVPPGVLHDFFVYNGNLVIIASGGIAVVPYNATDNTISDGVVIPATAPITHATLLDKKWLMLTTDGDGLKVCSIDKPDKCTSYTTTNTNNKLPTNSINYASVYNGTLFIATLNGLVTAKWQENGQINFADSKIYTLGLTHPNLSIVKATDKFIFISTLYNGLIIGKNEGGALLNFHSYNTTSSPKLPTDQITDFSLLNNELIIGTYGNGALEAKVNSTGELSNITRYTKSTNYLPPYSITSISSISNGRIALGTSGGGLVISSIDKNTGEINVGNTYDTNSDPKLMGNNINTVMLSNNDDMLIGLANGDLLTAIYKDGTISNISSTSLSNYAITSLAKTSDNTVFAGTNGSGLISFTYEPNTKSITNINTDTSISTINAIYIADNIVFIATSKGLVIGKYDTTRKSITETQTYLPDDNITCIKVDGESVYIGTEAHGIYIAKHSGNSLSSLENYSTSTTPALKSNNITTLSVYNGKKLVIGTTDAQLMIASLKDKQIISNVGTISLPIMGYPTNSRIVLNDKVLLGTSSGRLLMMYLQS
ncbi:ligand-binding sensor domain-containing protein [Facilibium subflavum]|uniref:hypothetical protein n=1 Tax=Facilibium subflavum TaxID=2219058 RepID=UPI000E652379|nr:hypothetical protein [Facilibium subflavum]